MFTFQKITADNIKSGREGQRSDRQLPLYGLPLLATLICAFAFSADIYHSRDFNGILSSMSSSIRQPSSLPFPRYASTTDANDVLSEYPAYLSFVLEVGKEVEPGTAKALRETYDKLRKRDARGAARFLRGLRFEMVQKLELIGANPAAVDTSTPVMRQWIRRYLKAWHREADEYLFRSLAFRSRKD